jgi:hypothetical protein
MRLRALSGIATLLLVLSTADLSAQVKRQGFWFSGGLGYGSVGCDDCDDRVGGGAGYLSLGGTVSPHWLLGVGTAGYTRDDDGVTYSVGTLDFRVRWYPSVTNGFFLTGGIGFGAITVDVEDGPENTEKGGALLVGLGYDIQIGRNVSLTPFANAFGVGNDETDANVAQIGLGITVH